MAKSNVSQTQAKLPKQAETETEAEEGKVKSEQEYLNEFIQESGYTPDATNEEEDLSTYEEERTTAFPPYWKPMLGFGFIARVVELDARDPEFLRYVLQSAQDELSCRQGRADADSFVTVLKGEYFSTSVYRGLPLHEYMGLEDPIMVVCVGTREVKGRPNDMWIFKIRTSKRDHAQLAERKAMKEGNGKAIAENVRRAFELSHTAKDAKNAAKAALATK